MGKYKAMLGPVHLATLCRPGPASDVHSYSQHVYMLQNQLFSSRTSQTEDNIYFSYLHEQEFIAEQKTDHTIGI